MLVQVHDNKLPILEQIMQAEEDVNPVFFIPILINNLSKMQVKYLKEQLTRGLSGTGKKGILVERLASIANDNT